jgi:transglutaminase-like putative cysteine protease
MSRWIRWVARRFGARNILLLTLLLLAIGSAVMGLADVVRGLDTALLWTVAAAGILAGWGLAALTIRWWTAGVLGSIFGVGLVFVRVGSLGDTLFSTLWLLIHSQWQTVLYSALTLWNRAPKPDWLSNVPNLSPPDWTPFLSAFTGLMDGLGILWNRLYGWLTLLLRGEAIYDPVAVALVWSFALWEVSVWAAWALKRRERPVVAVAPAGALLMITLSYARANPSISLLMLGAILGLLALIGYDMRVRRWMLLNIDFPDIGFEALTVALFLSLALVALSAMAPSISLRDIVDWMGDMRRERSEQADALSDSLGVERPAVRPKSTPLDAVYYGGLPRQHLLRSGPELSGELVMLVSTGDLPPGPPDVISAERQTIPNYYWRSLTYDVYNGRGWQTQRVEIEAYRAGHQLVTETLPTQRIVRQEVEIVGDVGALLYAAGDVLAVDHNYRVAWRSHRDAFGGIIETKTYRVDSAIPVVSEEALQAAGADYPEWITARYLWLPDTLPPQVLSLARDLTATASTPYDRAIAIESYLRQFPYTLDIPKPPSGEDVVAYFLFDLQKGYCDYYASAMVVLARAAGLPARLAVGYASGYYDWGSAQYIVTADKAHAWVEVYFPQYGWVAFEPTSSFERIKRASPEEDIAWAKPSETLEPVVNWWDVRAWDWWVGLLGVVGVIVGLSLAWVTVDGLRLRALKPAAAIHQLYNRLRRSGRRLSAAPRFQMLHPGDTPHEFSRTLTTRVEALILERGWGRVLRPIQWEIHTLSDLYVQTTYSPREPDRADRAWAIRSWQRLRWRLWVLLMLARG